MADGSSKAMDYNEHENTYEGFIKFAKIGSAIVLTWVVCLAVIAFGGTAGSVLGTLLIIASFAAAVAGVVSKNSPMTMPGAVFVLSMVALLFTAS
ncbi:MULTISPECIES: aa3-type cytochrome c oxidase subunit IV [Pseudovibrio]|uniref:aa3-type cytochrome c oxidase subunit IV n=1 Tax=Stappiaceae TaxID=2821832 RepID=UPI0023670D36|nr:MULTISPECIES: aa3-type cytochrome c oxidase subunit IV [Pseudovibrio]MDD7911872.1 aa3-type cytochrome c oxidase subunit IV [Pseudovibrio exalbescens]MDX5594681.1 aa3-type cytochrome c oxidase subunit IV [Pseudovibrio sp. SPO723]